MLVIDDEEIIRTLATRILEREGHEVLLAESGEKGLEILAENRQDIDLLLLDMRMEGLSGEETLERTRRLAPEVPCIISTGQIVEDGEMPQDTEAQVYFLQKPYRANALSDLVRKILKEV